MEEYKQYCLDFASLYTAFYYILIASLFLLASELIVFAVHTKYFSAWNYEVQLMEMEQKIGGVSSWLPHVRRQEGPTDMEAEEVFRARLAGDDVGNFR